MFLNENENDNNSSSRDYESSSHLSRSNDGSNRTSNSNNSSIISSNEKFDGFAMLKILYVASTIIEAVIGLLIIFKNRDISRHVLIFAYIVTYSFLWPIGIIICFAIASTIILYKILSGNMNLTARSNEEQDKRNTSSILAILAIVLVVANAISLPVAVYTIISVTHNALGVHKILRWMIYMFCTINFTNATGLISSFAYTILNSKKKKEKEKENNTDIIFDEAFLKKIEAEVEQSKRVSGIIAANSDLIKFNKLFNRQNVNFIKKEGAKPHAVENNKKFASIFPGGTYSTTKKNNSTWVNESGSVDRKSSVNSSSEIIRAVQEEKEKQKTQIRNEIRDKTMKRETVMKKSFIEELKMQITNMKTKEELNLYPKPKSPLIKSRSSKYDALGMELAPLDIGEDSLQTSPAIMLNNNNNTMPKSLPKKRKQSKDDTELIFKFSFEAQSSSRKGGVSAKAQNLANMISSVTINNYKNK